MPTIADCFPLGTKTLNEMSLALDAHSFPPELSTIVIEYASGEHTFLTALLKSKVYLNTEINDNFEFGLIKNTALNLAVQLSCLDVIRTLLDKQANVNLEVLGISPLSTAISRKNEEATKLLIEKGATEPKFDNRRRPHEFVFYKQCQETLQAHVDKEITAPSVGL